MAQGTPVALIAVGFVAFFALLWCFVLWVVSWVGGWRRLVDRFGAPFEFGGDVVAFVSARIGIANYSGMLIVGANDEGLYLVPIRIYRLFHRPLFIPWPETAASVRGRARWPRVRLTFPALPGRRILLYGCSAKHCLPYLRRHFDLDASEIQASQP